MTAKPGKSGGRWADVVARGAQAAATVVRRPESPPPRRDHDVVDAHDEGSETAVCADDGSADNVAAERRDLRDGSVPVLLEVPSCCFVIKAYSELFVYSSVKHGVLGVTDAGAERLAAAWAAANGARVLLLFSINGSGRFCGVAEMVSNVVLTSECEPEGTAPASLRQTQWVNSEKWKVGAVAASRGFLPLSSST